MGDVALSEIVDRLGGELIGDGGARISSAAPLEQADRTSIAFLSNPQYVKQLAMSQAGCVIVAPAFRDDAVKRGAAIVTPDPYLYFAKFTQWWAGRDRRQGATGIHASAVVDAGAWVADDASIGPFAVVEAGAVIAAGASIGAHAVVGRDCRVGADTRLGPHTSLMHGTRIGARCIVHPGAVLGADGFGFAPTQSRWEKIEQLGTVQIGDDVEIGANSCIDRGALGDTVIGDGVKIDNLVQIGHNVHVGAHTAMAGCVGIAGSARIGAHCTLGGGAIVLGHLSLADHVNISAASVVMRSIRAPGHYTGFFPIDENAAWEKNAASLRQLHALRDRVKALEKKS